MGLLGKLFGANEDVVNPQAEQPVIELDKSQPGSIIPIIIAGIEQFRKTLAYAGPGENVGILIGNIDRNQIDMGDTLQGIPE